MCHVARKRLERWWWGTVAASRMCKEIMTKHKRKQEIVDYLVKNGSASVAELACMCNVSQMTIRRDLDELSAEGVVERTHGGAIYVAPDGEVPFEVKVSRGSTVKKSLAEFAVRTFVRDKMVVALEGGTTIGCVSECLRPFKGLTILSNGLNSIANLKGLDSSSSVICTGGIVRWVNYTVVGPLVTTFFGTFSADVGFFSAIGFTLKDGFTDADVLESQARREMAKACSKVVIVIESSKFGVRSALKTFDIEDVDVVVTDNGAPHDVVDELRSRGVEVHVVQCG